MSEFFYPDRSTQPGLKERAIQMMNQKVRVHYALTGPNAGRWVVTQRGKTLTWLDELTLVDATPVICESMRQRVSHASDCGCSSKCGRRSIHAWIDGTIVDYVPDPLATECVRYNPRRFAWFYWTSDLQPFTGSPVVRFTSGTVSAVRH